MTEMLETLVKQICELEDKPMSASQLWLKGYEPRHRDLVKHINGLIICFHEQQPGSSLYEFGCIMKNPDYNG